MNMSPRKWTNLILSRHGLERPDGRQLFQYRVTNNEFEDLKSLLVTSTLLGLENITRNMPSWDAAFVMYASEWWRRSYEGLWGWEGIFNSIGIDYKDLSASRRSELISNGLLRWRRDVRIQNGSHKYLGTVATEGGLPLHQLAAYGGWLKNVLQPVLKKHISRDILISTLIENYEDLIPSAYRSTETTEILINIAKKVVTLRQEHELMNKDSPLNWLDSNKPDWRELFPLPIDDEAGTSLLSDLIDAASKTKADEHTKNPFEVERFLIRAESDTPELIAQLEMPTFGYFDGLGIDLSSTSFPSRVTLEIYSSGRKVWPWCEGIVTTYRQKKALKFSGRTLKLFGLDAAKELKLRFKAIGEIVHELDLANGDSLDADLPWLFKRQNEKWTLHGVASQSIESDVAIAFIPSNYCCKPLDENTQISKYGKILSGHILKISGTIRCSRSDESYKLAAGVEESVNQYYWSGKRFPNGTKPGEIFLGVPQLMKKNTITGRSSVIRGNRLVTKPVGVETDWRSLSQDSIGYYEIRLRDSNGDIQLRKRIGILDEHFTFKIKPDNNEVKKGSIQLFCVENSQVNVSSENISANIVQASEFTEIQLEADETPPLSVNVSVLPSSNKRELVLTLPFPSNGALLFNAKGEQVPFSSSLYMNKLTGYRVKVFIDQVTHAQKAALVFELIDPNLPNENLQDLYVRREIVVGGNDVNEFSLHDWVPVIDSLMRVSSSIDTRVKVSLTHSGRNVFVFHVCRYENEMIPRYNENIVELDSKTFRNIGSDVLENIRIAAFSLNQPEHAIDSLEPQTSELALIGKWNFSPGTVKPGSWLIYPLKESQIQFRPLRWDVGLPIEFDQNSISEIDTLPKAINIPDQELRNQAIRNVLLSMADNLKHKSWKYLTQLWKKSGHLAMSTFDIWKLAINETGILSSLLVCGKDDIIEKMENEFPLIWELVRLKDWEMSLKLYYEEKLQENRGDDEDFIRDLMRKKIEKIESLNLSMISIGHILRHNLLNQPSPELARINKLTNRQLKQEHQGLLRRQAESDWPVILSNDLSRKKKTLPNSYSHLLEVHHDHHRSAVFLPLVLAWRTLSIKKSDWPSSTVDLFKIQQLIQFDEDWFSTSFQYLSGWLSQQEYLEK